MSPTLGALIAQDPAAKKDHLTACVTSENMPHHGSNGIMTAHAHTEAVAITVLKERQETDLAI